MGKDTWYEDDNRKDEKNNGQYDRFCWSDDDKDNNRGRHSHEWIDTYSTTQGFHGENTSKEDKNWSGHRWNDNKKR